MKIQILSVNNAANEEASRPYDESDLIQGSVRLSDNFASATGTHKIFVQPSAVREIFDFIEWDVGTRPDLRVEQGGILLGKRFVDEEAGIHFALVSKAITAKNAIGTTGFLEITHECWKVMHDEKDAYNEDNSDDAIIVGWFHTHPNSLSCFMSGTDRQTQDLFFDGENTYSLVINPQRHLMKAYRSSECHPTQAFLMLDS